jgi:hypothetical protein
VDNGAGGLSILVWLSPILGPIVAIGLGVVVFPLVVGAVSALVVALKRIAQSLTSRSSNKPVTNPEPLPADPWAQLTALSETPRNH